VKIGIRVTIAGLVLTAIAASTIGVHLLWWRTAQRISRDLAATINQHAITVRGRAEASQVFELRVL
jgi:adenylate cyclase